MLQYQAFGDHYGRITTKPFNNIRYLHVAISYIQRAQSISEKSSALPTEKSKHSLVPCW